MSNHDEPEVFVDAPDDAIYVDDGKRLPIFTEAGLTQHDADVRRTVAEEIAAAIEADRFDIATMPTEESHALGTTYPLLDKGLIRGLTRAARIARDFGGLP